MITIMSLMRKVMTETKEKVVIGCLSVQMANWNPSSVIAESIVKQCDFCGIDVWLSPSGQKMYESQPSQLICMSCASTLRDECQKTGEPINYDVVPGAAQDLKNHFDKEMD